MNFVVVGVSFKNTTVDFRERIAFNTEKRNAALHDLSSRYGSETIILSTCNRVELYLAKPAGGDLPGTDLIAEFLGESHQISAEQVVPHLVERRNTEGIRHLFRVAASLDSLIVGEGQIAGQVKEAFETALTAGVSGPMLNALFQAAQRAAKRVRTETGITDGHISVSSVAVDYVKQVFDHFGDKTILVIGAGKMGRLTLKHLQELKPKQILIANRSPEKAAELAALCGGRNLPWDKLDEGLIQADIILSTTGAPEPVVTVARYAKARAKRGSRTSVILDIAVPRDFEPAIHDGESTFLFNIDDLKSVCEQTLAKRRSHIEAAELIVEEECRRFLDDWGRRKNGLIIAELTKEFESKRQEVMAPLLGRLNGKLSDRERQDIEGAFRLFQNKLLHGPISALSEASREGTSHGLVAAVRKLFRLKD